MSSILQNDFSSNFDPQRSASAKGRALALARQAVSVEPESSRATAELGLALMASGMTKEGLETLKRATWLNPSDLDIGYQYRSSLALTDLTSSESKLAQAQPDARASPVPLWDSYIFLVHYLSGDVSSAMLMKPMLGQDASIVGLIAEAIEIGHEGNTGVARKLVSTLASHGRFDRTEAKAIAGQMFASSTVQAKLVNTLISLGLLNGDAGCQGAGC